MISRYENNKIQKIWNEENKIKIWKDVEVFVCEAWNKEGLISDKELTLIKKNIKVDVKLMKTIEAETKHDVVAFTRMLSTFLGPEKRFIHFGLTSTDIVDTAQNYLIKQSNDVVLDSLNILIKSISIQADKWKNQPIIGRTHGMNGEITSLGLKFLNWEMELKRAKNTFLNAKKEIEVAKISGSMGNFAHMPLRIEEHVAKKMELNIDPVTSQVNSRDRHVKLYFALATIGNLLEKIATEIRHLQRSEVNEISEGFSKKQKGSSSMPHKKNPISSENINGLARYLRTFVNVGFENNNLWHERDISHSSNERLIIPDAFHTCVYILDRMNDTIENLYVNTEQINLRINKNNGLIFSQAVMNLLIKNSKNSREEIYDFIQKTTLELQSNKHSDFKIALIKNGIEKYVNLKDLDLCFKPETFLENVELIFKRARAWS